MQLKILITTSSYDVEAAAPLERLREDGIEIVLNPFGRRLTEAEVAELLDEQVVGMIAGVEPLTRKVLEGAKSLKVISRAGIGMDSVDQDAARKLGIHVNNTPNAPVAAAAELTVGLMLDLLRNISASDRALRAGTWKPLMGGLLGARTVGLIGCGRIGSAVASLVKGFGCRLLVHDPVRQKTDGELVSLERLLSESDIVSLHLPYSEHTRHLINAERLSQMKRGAILVNASRGGLVDEKALYKILQEGHLAGAGMDTFEEEPYNGPLVSLPQVVLTAHMGSYARESRARMEYEAAENLLKGLALKGVLAGQA